MKIWQVMGCAFLLSGCMAQPIQSYVDACPVEGLTTVTFRQGGSAAPVVPSAAEAGGGMRWVFSEKSGDVYLSCLYAGGGERRQKLPAQFKSCTRAPGAGLVCQGEI